MGSTFKRKRKRPDGSFYEVYVIEETWEGVKKTLTGKTEKEARSKMKAWLREMAVYGDKLAKNSSSFGDYFYNYLFKVQLNKVEPTTFTTYKGLYDKHISGSKLSRMKPDSITYDDIQEYFNSKRSVMATATMNKLKYLLNGCFKYAKRNKVIRENPIEGFSVPKSAIKKKEIRVLSVDEQKRYITALNDSPCRLILLLALFTGLRLGELIALTWGDIDEEIRVIRVDKSIKRTKVFEESGEYEKKDVLKGTKTNRDRTVPIPEFLIEELKAMDHSTKYVFVTGSGSHYSPENIRREHIRVCTAAKIGEPTIRKYHRTYKHKDGSTKEVELEKVEYLDVNLHALRHTYATRLFNYGESAKMVQSLLGHTKLSTTMDIYTHVLENDKLGVSAKLSKIYNDLT